MGSGASGGLSAAIESATMDELGCLVKALDDETCTRLRGSLNKAYPAEPPETYPAEAEAYPAEIEGGGSVWAWLGDMEMDDTVLGLGATGVFGSPPVALGFLINFAHCAKKDKDTGKITFNGLLREKRRFLEYFFGGKEGVNDKKEPGGGEGFFFPIFDNHKRKCDNQPITAEDLQEFKDRCHIGSECCIRDFCEAIARHRAKVVHLLLSGPLLDNGKELQACLEEMVLPFCERMILWSYAGSFNITNSSADDKAAIKGLLENNPKMQMIETTLKPSSWVCKPAYPFWSSACPVSWTEEEAKKNPVGYNMSCDVQGVNQLLELASWETADGGKVEPNLPWLFGHIADGLDGGARDRMHKFAAESHFHALDTNLKKMVQPDAGPLVNVRDMLPATQEEINETWQKAIDVAKAGAGSPTESLPELVEAAKRYVELYRGDDDFLETGLVNYLPPGKPTNGPRLDKRSILRAIAKGSVQGGATADTLVILVLLLQLDKVDPSLPKISKPLPQETMELFQAQQCSEVENCCSVCLSPKIQHMDAAVLHALRALLEEMIAAIIRGARQLVTIDRAGCTWGYHDGERPLSKSPSPAD
jgi:hypothetical protein